MLMKMAVRNNRERYSIQIIEIDSMSINISHLYAFLGEGAYSWVYALKNTPYAAKISKFNDRGLEKEFAILESLGRNSPTLFPHVVSTGTVMLPDGQTPASYMMMERLGVSLQDFLIFRGELSLPTILQIGRQLLEQIGALMQSGIVHNDIKPTNILFGMGDKRKAVFLVDYGMAVTANCETKRVFRGNLAFAASRKLKGNIQYDLRNDLQSLIYVLLWALRNGDLPWQQRQQGETTLPERANQILALRQQFKEEYLKKDNKHNDKRSTLIRKLILMSAQQGLTACELFAHLQCML